MHAIIVKLLANCETDRQLAEAIVMLLRDPEGSHQPGEVPQSLLPLAGERLRRLGSAGATTAACQELFAPGFHHHSPPGPGAGLAGLGSAAGTAAQFLFPRGPRVGGRGARSARSNGAAPLVPGVYSLRGGPVSPLTRLDSRALRASADASPGQLLRRHPPEPVDGGPDLDRPRPDVVAR